MCYCILHTKQNKKTFFISNILYFMHLKILYIQITRTPFQPAFDNYKIYIIGTVMRLPVPPAQNDFSIILPHWYSKEHLTFMLSLAYFQITGISFTIFVFLLLFQTQFISAIWGPSTLLADTFPILYKFKVAMWGKNSWLQYSLINLHRDIINL
jgi:hypothetical protein